MNKNLKYLRTLKLMKCALYGLYILKKLSAARKKRIRSCSAKQVEVNRKDNGFFFESFLVMKEIDHQQFFIYTRMSPRMYENLLELVRPFLVKNSLRQPVQPECRLAVTLLYLTQGTSIQSLARSFKLGKETVRGIIFETTEVIWKALSNAYVCELNENDYKQIAEDFWRLWNVPNCLGAIAGKHMAIQCPPRSNSQLLSIVLIAACDARYQFTHIDIGAYGSQTDGGIFQLSRFGKRLLGNKLPIPPPKNLPNTQLKTPHYFVADAAFPLAMNLMRPYPGEQLPPDKEAFNKRLSRACLTIENAFGILVSRWQVLRNTFYLLPENAEKIVLACISLHNFLMLSNESSYIPKHYIDWEDSEGKIHDGIWRSTIKNNIPSILPSAKSHQYGGKRSTEIRNNLCNFFSNI